MFGSESIRIPLTKGYETIVDLEDSHLLRFKWCALLVKSGLVYAARRSFNGIDNSEGKFILMHRVILNYTLATELDSNWQCDHINGNGLDNRRSNLRLATKSQNGLNRKMRKDNTSGIVGVMFDKKSKKWQAVIQFNRKRTRLGTFSSFEEARDARYKAEKEIFGDFSVLSSRGYRPK